VHFEVSAADPERAAAFYRQAFGWSAQRWSAGEGAPEYWLLSTGEGDGIDGGMTRRGETSFPGTTVTISVGDLAATLRSVQAAGGAVLVAAMEVPGVGLLAYCSDPDGNAFGVLQPVPSPG
jgi:predicted enzyme related to lactoylglutathione lyase